MFNIDDMVYASDWCFGKIIAIADNQTEYMALVEFETPGGGGSLWFSFSELRHAN